jgi:hypothetical protein
MPVTWNLLYSCRFIHQSQITNHLSRACTPATQSKFYAFAPFRSHSFIYAFLAIFRGYSSSLNVRTSFAVP